MYRFVTTMFLFSFLFLTACPDSGSSLSVDTAYQSTSEDSGDVDTTSSIDADSNVGLRTIDEDCDDDGDPCTVEKYYPQDRHCAHATIPHCIGSCEEGEEYKDNACVHSTWEGGGCAKIKEPYCTLCKDGFDCQLAYSNGTLDIFWNNLTWCQGDNLAYESSDTFICVYGKCEHLVEYEDCKDALGPDGYCYDDSFFPAKCQKYPYGNCDDSIACTVDFFSTVSQQCEHVPDCNDGDPDTIDVCDYQTGGCASGWGPCESDEDCDLNVAYLPSCKDGVWYVTGMKDRKCVDSICTYPFKAQTICPLGCDDGDPSFCNCESDADCPTNIFPHTSCQKVYDSDDNVYSLCWYDD